MKKVLVTRKLLRSNEERLVKLWDVILNSDDQIYSSKKIIEFCGLDWEEECLNFHKNKAPIKTMSTAQARKPLYKSSLDSYEKFSPYLETLNEIIN